MIGFFACDAAALPDNTGGKSMTECAGLFHGENI